MIKNIGTRMKKRLFGQDEAVDRIEDFLETYRAGINAPGKPAGVFLLLGPTGAGKTETAVALSYVLHGRVKNEIIVHCSEFQEDHATAKLIGSPPGYVGHDKTEPFLNQGRLNDATSEACDLSVIVFDEIEKASSSLHRLLLGVLDKATLRLGNNAEVNFQKTLILLTANLGVREAKKVSYDFLAKPITKKGVVAAKKFFDAEFMNRVDVVLDYEVLSRDAYDRILDREVYELQRSVTTRLGPLGFGIELKPNAREWLIAKGTSEEYGARELKRVVQRHVTRLVASCINNEEAKPGSVVEIGLEDDRVVLRAMEPNLDALLKVSLEHARLKDA